MLITVIPPVKMKPRIICSGNIKTQKVGDYRFYDGTSEENKKKYAGGFVWQMDITSHYPDEGFRIPYSQYLDKPEIFDKIAIIPENDRNFKYATRNISDDDALELVEQFLEVVGYLLEIGDKTENWSVRKNGLNH